MRIPRPPTPGKLLRTARARKWAIHQWLWGKLSGSGPKD